ncbi:hypothetical protein [Parachlamydia acanthamoebae]|jgi:fructose-bisphosphate aldolase class 1|nr:hypothetical protein [Parachlamydia acanthamoebae]EFB42227.1 hypothetical protein pah_c014o171 [Parachlamydia acanthamoebae str. Hall's coccus]
MQAKGGGIFVKQRYIISHKSTNPSSGTVNKNCHAVTGMVKPLIGGN